MCFACEPPCPYCAFGRVYEKNPKTGIDHPREIVKTLCSECASMADPEDLPAYMHTWDEGQIKKLFSQKLLENLTPALEHADHHFPIDPEIAAAKAKRQREIQKQFYEGRKRRFGY